MRVNKNELSLESPFEAKGRWWLPELPEQRVGGILKFAPEGIDLELHGSLSAPTLGELGKLRSDLDRFPLIFGDTDAGPCTLVRAFLTGLDHNLAETTHSSYSAIYLILGSHVQDESIPCRSVSFSCRRLDDFLGPAAFAVEDDRDEGVFQGTTVRYLVPKPLVCDVSSDDARLEFEQHLLRSESRVKVALTARHAITITPSSEKPFQWHLERLWKVCYLLTLLSDETVSPERIEVNIEGQSEPQLFFYQKAGSPTEAGRPSSLLLFYCSHVADRMADILNRWFSASPTLTSSIHLYMNGQRPTSLHEGRFLTLCQAFEAFSRATMSAEYMSAEEYEDVAGQLIKAIPGVVASDHRASLKSRITYGNEHSLRKRLTQALKSLPPEAVECICKSASAFVSGVVDTRNYLTHYTEELRPKALRGANLLWACERITMLLRILLLRELGIDMSLIVQRVREHPRLLQYQHLYHEHSETAD